jgi:hypothetical protein
MARASGLEQEHLADRNVVEETAAHGILGLAKTRALSRNQRFDSILELAHCNRFP